MKKLIIGFLLTLLSTLSVATPVPLTEVSEVVQIEKMSKKQIYDSAKVWVVKSFKSSKSVIEYEDAASGIIMGKGNMPYPCSGFSCLMYEDYKIFFTIRIDTKDNKARITFSDLMMRIPENSLMAASDVPLTSDKNKQNVALKLKEIVEGFKVDVQKNNLSSDW